MELGEKIQMLRKQNGLTQEQLAERLFVSRTAVSKWESGRGYPSIDSLQELSKVFSVTVDELLSHEQLISLAKSETKANAKKLMLRFFGIIDVLFLTFIFLPLFGEMKGEEIVSVSVIASVGLEPWIRITYIAVLSLLAAFGIAEEILQGFLDRKRLNPILIASLALNAALVLLSILNREPYVAAFSFCFLAAKAVTLLNPAKKRKNPERD